MLQAICNGKSQLYKRYLGHRDEGERRASEEDEITSLIMGPLQYIPPAQATDFWRAVIEHEGPLPLLFPAGPAEQVRMHFWPRSTIEPDLLVELIWTNRESRLLLIEFKWRAPLSGKNQLHRQWQEFFTGEERHRAYHLFIGPEITPGLNAKAEQDIWNGKLLLRSWLSILHVLGTLNGNGSAGMQTWITQVSIFLTKLGIARFHGFSHLTLAQAVERSPVFWNPFKGFTTLEFVPPPSQIKISSPVFWSSKP